MSDARWLTSACGSVIQIPDLYRIGATPRACDRPAACRWRSGWRRARGDRGGACGRSAVVPWWWLRCASLRKSLYRGTVYRDGKTSYLRTETEMRAANPEPASALWPRHIGTSSHMADGICVPAHAVPQIPHAIPAGVHKPAHNARPDLQ